MIKIKQITKKTPDRSQPNDLSSQYQCIDLPVIYAAGETAVFSSENTGIDIRNTFLSSKCILIGRIDIIMIFFFF